MELKKKRLPILMNFSKKKIDIMSSVYNLFLVQLLLFAHHLFLFLSFSLLFFLGISLLPGALQIENTEETDQGKYECVATNVEGVRYSSPANLYVRGREQPGLGDPLRPVRHLSFSNPVLLDSKATFKLGFV